MTKERKEEIIKTFATHEGDTGSPEVQIALLTERINFRHIAALYKAVLRVRLNKVNVRYFNHAVSVSTNADCAFTVFNFNSSYGNLNTVSRNR